MNLIFTSTIFPLIPATNVFGILKFPTFKTNTGFINMSVIFNETKSSTENIYIYDITTIQSIQVYVLNNDQGAFLIISGINDDSEIPHTLTISRLEQENLTLGTYENVTKNSTVQLALSDYDAKYDVFKICMTDALNRTKCFYFPDIQIGILRIKTQHTHTTLQTMSTNYHSTCIRLYTKTTRPI